MKALDTNVLLRYLVEDDPVQARQAARIIEDARRREEQLFLPLLVICETVWVLSRRYRQARSVIAEGLEQILETDIFLVEQADVVRTCLTRFRSGKGSFPDYVIGAVAEQAGCSITVTFDQDLEGSGGFQVL